MEKRKQASLLNFFQTKKSKTDIEEVEVVKKSDDGDHNSSLIVVDSCVSVMGNDTPCSSSCGSRSNNNIENTKESLTCRQNLSIDNNDIVLLKKKKTFNKIRLFGVVETYMEAVRKLRVPVK